MSANPKLPTDLSAKRINEQHRLAKASAETAIQHAVLCGELLAEQKSRLKHGEFQGWIEKHCEFAYSTASRYMTAAKKISTGVEFSSLSHLFPSGKKQKPPAQISTAVEISPQPPATEAARSAHIPTKIEHAEQPASAPPLPNGYRWSDDPQDDEDEILERAEAEYAASIDKVMSADDKLAAAHAEIKRQAAEIAVLKISRDGYMNGKAAMTELLKKEQRKNERLEKEIKKLRDAK